MMQLRRCGGGLLLSGLLVSGARGQTVELLHPRILDGPYRSFQVGQPLDLGIEPPSLGWFGVLRACAFRASPTGTPLPFREDESCVFYDCICKPVEAGLITAGLPITVTKNWLRPIGQDTLADETYALVFLRGSWASEVLNLFPEHEWVKLKKGDENRYFDGAYTIKVLAPPGMSRAQERHTVVNVRNLTAERNQQLDATLGTPAAVQKPECLRLVETNENGVKVAYLQPCEWSGS